MMRAQSIYWTHEQDHRTLKLMDAVALAFLLHLFLFHFLGPIPVTRIFSPPMKIRVIAVPAPVVAAPAVPAVPSKTSTSSQQATPHMETRVAHPAIETGKQPYLNLLPRTDLQLGASTDSAAGEQPLGVKSSPELQSHADILASDIDIPLTWRKIAKAGVAYADIEIRNGHELWCRGLSGTPVLRAVLWQFLHKPKTLETLAGLLKGEDKDEYQIVLRFLPVEGAERTINITDGSTAYQRGIEIIKTRPTPTRDFGGVPLSDEDSRKAIYRDRMALNTLFELPAFDHAMRDVNLGRF